MTPERVRQIEDLYHAAREDRAVLAQADPDLRREVESLLAQDSSAAGYVDQLAWPAAGLQILTVQRLLSHREPNLDLTRSRGLWELAAWAKCSAPWIPGWGGPWRSRPRSSSSAIDPTVRPRADLLLRWNRAEYLHAP